MFDSCISEEGLEESQTMCDSSPVKLDNRYALITPVRDEEAYIGDMIASIAAQTIPPSLWVIVDDGSADKTAQIVSDFASHFPFIKLVQLPLRQQRLAGGEGAVPNALKYINLNDYDFLGRFDADLVFPHEYIESILREFRRDPKLGIAGGELYVERKGVLAPEKNPLVHVRGALKMYRVQCFNDIGGLTSQIGWDTIDEVYAWSKSWTTRSFPEYKVVHRRPTGDGIAGTRVYKERGRAEYLTWSHPFFVLAKSIKILFRERSVARPICYLAGFISSNIRRESRLQDVNFASTRRREQRQRLTSLMALGRRRAT
jgi:glycosyltransferase involved in cell wall biosynthesis